MNRLPIVAFLTAGLFLASCSKRIPEYVNSIPDDAVAVVSLHPMQIYEKGQMNTLENLKKKAGDEVWSMILEDPRNSGLVLDEYAYLFLRMEEEAPVIGMVSRMKEPEKFEEMLGNIKEGISSEFTQMEEYKYVQPDNQGIIAWSEKQMILLVSPDHDDFDLTYWTATLDWMFQPVREESVTSLVDFKDFQGKMKDINLWMSTDEMQKIIEKFGKDKIGQLPVTLYNNYTHMYCDFADGEMNITGEINWSEEVQKNLDEVLVMNPSLNQALLEMAPGGQLLVAMAVSMDLEKLQALANKFSSSDSLGMGNKVEEATGIPVETLMNAFTGDFTLAINGLDGEAMIPVEVFIGFGVKSQEVQKLLMEKVEEMVPVEKEGDFFIINIQGTEIYSGILNDTWMITNMKGYKDAVSGGKLETSLLDSRFSDFSDGSMGMYWNLDLESYPDLIKSILDQKPEQKEWIEKLTDPFDYLGVSAGNNKGHMILKTNQPDENSLYTILKLTDRP